MPSGRYGISGGRGPYPVFSAWRQFAGNVFETQYRKAFSLPENAVKFGSALFVHMVHSSFHIAAFQAG